MSFCQSYCKCHFYHAEARDNEGLYIISFWLSIPPLFSNHSSLSTEMSPIIDFVRRQLSSTKLHEEQQTATTNDLVSRSGYLNEGKYEIRLNYYQYWLLTKRLNYIGTAMDHAKRQRLGLNGLLPAGVETLEIQKARALRVLRSKHDLLEKYILMAQLRTTNVRLFYKIVIDELEVYRLTKQ